MVDAYICDDIKIINQEVLTIHNSPFTLNITIDY